MDRIDQYMKDKYGAKRWLEITDRVHLYEGQGQRFVVYVAANATVVYGYIDTIPK